MDELNVTMLHSDCLNIASSTEKMDLTPFGNEFF